MSVMDWRKETKKPKPMITRAPHGCPSSTAALSESLDRQQLPRGARGAAALCSATFTAMKAVVNHWYGIWSIVNLGRNVSYGNVFYHIVGPYVRDYLPVLGFSETMRQFGTRP